MAFDRDTRVVHDITLEMHAVCMQHAYALMQHAYISSEASA